ncbi:Fur family transcriptional regulator [Leptolyngbya sp. FACHB-261]|uniref:Fur family transcriptional regulator n=1 Tax=Leptolyngbya sp. FACHB-261 TaxID=2692806 RepID=UPI0016864B04|nr:Fur family transcriptional regulator [Leptolyngbya sp. FACHB-261]MBD2103219.1 transcriptional repressor [Leptolyngbya sp. FACHB-261]
MSSYVVTAQSLKAELNQKGWRLTPQREEILNVFQTLKQGDHLSAEDLYDQLRVQGSRTSLSTIYRTLKLMARMGILRELELAEGHKHYELIRPHHHLVCVKCNRIIEFKSNSVLKIGSKVAQHEGYKLQDCQLVVHAVCPECQRSLVFA